MRLDVWCKNNFSMQDWDPGKPDHYRGRRLGYFEHPVAPEVGSYIVLHEDYCSFEVKDVHHLLYTHPRTVLVEVAWIPESEWPPPEEEDVRESD